MSSSTLLEIESRIPMLTRDEQLQLIERLAQQLQRDTSEASVARRSPYSIEELERRRKERTGKTLAEIRTDLIKHGINL